MFAPWFIELVSVLSNVCVGISALAVTIISFVGLQQWRRELTGKTKFDVAHRMAVLANRYRDEYKKARNPFTFPGESSKREKGENETHNETDILDEYFARQGRLTPLQDILRQLYEISWEAEILLDKNINRAIVPLEDSFKKLYSSIQAYFFTRYELIRRNHDFNNDESMQNYYKVIYGYDDEISDEVEIATSAIVNKMKSYLK